jgi:hypothetical protein
MDTPRKEKSLEVNEYLQNGFKPRVMKKKIPD